LSRPKFLAAASSFSDEFDGGDHELALKITCPPSFPADTNKFPQKLIKFAGYSCRPQLQQSLRYISSSKRRQTDDRNLAILQRRPCPRRAIAIVPRAGEFMIC
jgi:hypothetical protein